MPEQYSSVHIAGNHSSQEASFDAAIKRAADFRAVGSYDINMGIRLLVDALRYVCSSTPPDRLARVHSDLGLLYMEKKDPANAEVHFRNACSNDPNNEYYAYKEASALLELGRLREAIDCLFIAADCALKNKRGDDCETVYRHILSLAVTPDIVGNAHRGLAGLYHVVGLQCEMDNNHVQAKRRYLMACEHDPENVDYRCQLAHLHRRLGEHQEATDSFVMAADLCYKTKNYEKSELIYLEAIQNDDKANVGNAERGLAVIYSEIGAQHLASKDYGKAEDFFHDACELNKNNPDYHRSWALTLHSLGRHSYAIDNYTLAGTLFLDANRFEEGRAMCDAAIAVAVEAKISLSSTSIRRLCHAVGSFFLKDKNYAMAIQYFQKEREDLSIKPISNKDSARGHQRRLNSMMREADSHRYKGELSLSEDGYRLAIESVGEAGKVAPAYYGLARAFEKKGEFTTAAIYIKAAAVRDPANCQYVATKKAIEGRLVQTLSGQEKREMAEKERIHQEQIRKVAREQKEQKIKAELEHIKSEFARERERERRAQRVKEQLEQLKAEFAKKRQERESKLKEQQEQKRRQMVRAREPSPQAELVTTTNVARKRGRSPSYS